MSAAPADTPTSLLQTYHTSAMSKRRIGGIGLRMLLLVQNLDTLCQTRLQ
jgi:hypothetical protein